MTRPITILAVALLVGCDSPSPPYTVTVDRYGGRAFQRYTDEMPYMRVDEGDDWAKIEDKAKRQGVLVIEYFPYQWTEQAQ